MVALYIKETGKAFSITEDNVQNVQTLVENHIALKTEQPGSRVCANTGIECHNLVAGSSHFAVQVLADNELVWPGLMEAVSDETEPLSLFGTDEDLILRRYAPAGFVSTSGPAFLSSSGDKLVSFAQNGDNKNHTVTVESELGPKASVEFGLYSSSFNDLSASGQIKVVPITDAVYEDQATFTAAFQLLDEMGNVADAETIPQIQLKAYPNDVLRNLDDAAPSGYCTPSGIGGTCTVTTDVFPSAWFGIPGGKVTMRYGFASQEMSELSTVTLQTTPANVDPSAESPFVLDLPSTAVAAGSVFQGTFRGDATLGIKSFAIDLSSAASAVVAGSTEYDSSHWNVYVSNGKVIGLPKIEVGAAPGDYPVPDVTISFAAANEASMKVAAVVSFLTTAGGIVSENIAVPVNGREGGAIEIASNKVLGLFLFMNSVNVMNTAVITGVKLEIPVHVLEVHSVPVEAHVVEIESASYKCEHGNDQAFAISQSCNFLVFDGSETASGSVKVVVENDYALHVHVWIPDRDSIKVVLGDSTLNAIEGCGSSSDNNFQKTYANVYATFVSGNEGSHEVQITHMVSDIMRSLDESVADVFVATGNGAVVVIPKAEGEVLIAAGPFATTSLTVSSKTVSIESFDLYAIASATVAYEPVFSVDYTQTANKGGQLSHIVGEMSFSDGTSQFVSRDAYTVVSWKKDVVTITSEGMAQATGSGVGAYIEGTLKDPLCNVAGTGIVENALAIPSGATLVLEGNMLTIAGDLAAATGVGYPVILGTQLFVNFNDGEQQGISADEVEWTYDEQLLAMFEGGIVVAGTAKAALVETGKFTTEVTASFGDDNATEAVTIVFADEFAVQTSSSMLKQIDASGKFQKAHVEALVTFLDTSIESVDVTTSSILRIENAPDWVAIDVQEDQRILNHRGDATDGGAITIVASFGPAEATTTVEFSGAIKGVKVDSISFVDSIDGPAGTYARPTAQLLLDDGSKIAATKGFVTWSSDSPDIVDVNSETGLVKLLSTSSVRVLLTAKYLGTTKSVEFTCNAAPTSGVRLGESTGMPITGKSQSGSKVGVPLSMQSTSSESVEITVEWDAEGLSLASIAAGSALSSDGLYFTYRIHKSGTSVVISAFRLGGLVGALGCKEESCTDEYFFLNFKVGSVKANVDYTMSATAAGVTNEVPFRLTPGGRARRAVGNKDQQRAASTGVRARREDPFATAGNPVYDFNLDGVLNLADFMGAIEAILADDTSSTAFDANGDGVFNLNDADFFGRVHAGFYSFVGPLQVTPIELHSCALKASIALMGIADPADNTTTHVFFVLSDGSQVTEVIEAAPVSDGVFGIEHEHEPASAVGGISVFVSTESADGNFPSYLAQPLIVSSAGTNEVSFKGLPPPEVRNAAGKKKTVTIPDMTYKPKSTFSSKMTTTGCIDESNQCLSEPCENDGDCTNLGPDGYFCECTEGFTGTSCELVDSIVSSGEGPNATTSSGVSPVLAGCAGAPCMNGGNCTDTSTNGNFTCECTWPWMGSDDCGSHVCENMNGGCGANGRCNTNAGKEEPLCTCDAGFQGDACDELSSVLVASSTNNVMATSTIITIAAVVGVFVLIVLPLVCVCLCKRSKGASADEKRLLNWQGMDNTAGGTNGPPAYTSPLAATTFDGTGAHTIVSPATQLAHLKSKMVPAAGQRQPPWQLEFASVKKSKDGATFRVSEDPANQRRNRYKDIRAYDDTRVFLMNDENDYINANMVTTSVAGRQFWYVAAQGPTPMTTPHFWDMVWEQQSQIIVMVTNDVEAGKVKCDAYWPTEGVEKQYGNLVVSLTRKQGNSDYTIRGIQIRNLITNEQRVCWQLHFTSWPDHGVPKDEAIMLAFIDELRSVRAKLMPPSPQAPWPIVVHCSAGIGRTGVVMSLEIALAKLEAGQLVEMKDIMRDLRNQRYGMIQKDIQYQFVYSTLIKAMENSELVSARA